MRFIPAFIAFIIFAPSCKKSQSDHKNEEKVIVQDIPDDPETKAFMKFWKEFSSKFDSLDTASVRKITLDTIWLWGDRIACTDFIKRYYIGYSNSGFSKIILDANKTNYSSIGCHPSPPVKGAVKVLNQSKRFGEASNCRDVTIRDTLGADVEALNFTFLETTVGFKLFGISYYSYTSSPVTTMVDTTVAEW